MNLNLIINKFYLKDLKNILKNSELNYFANSHHNVNYFI